MGASSLVLNPASAALRQGLFMNVGGMLNLRDAEFSGTHTLSGPVPEAFSYSTDNPVEALPQISFCYAPSKMPLGFGLSVTEPFQMNTAWPSAWPGFASVEDFSVHAVFTSLSLGYRVNRLIVVGGGVHIVTGGFAMQSNTLMPNNTGETQDYRSSYPLQIHGNGTSAAVSVSAIVAPAPQFSMAIGYQTGANIPVKGVAEGMRMMMTTGQYVSGDAAFHTSLAVPAMLTFGIDVHPTNAFRIDAGVQFVGWAGFDGLGLNYADTTLANQWVGPILKNATSLHMGAEVLISRSLALRAGVGYSTTSLKNDSAAAYFPDGASFNYAVGLGYQFTKNIRFDLGWRGSAVASPRGTASTGYNGTYAISQNLLAASIALAFEPTANPLRSPSSK